MDRVFCGIYNAMTKGNKEVNLNLRVRADVRDEFKVVAELRGASVSSLIHQFMVKTIREEKEIEPEAFAIREESNIIPRGEPKQIAVGQSLKNLQNENKKKKTG